MKIKIKKIIKKEDTRGWLAELLREEDLKRKKFGQIFITTAHPGQTKGNHYHTRKYEWYIVLKGSGIVRVVDIYTKKQKKIFVNENDLKAIELPPYHFHSITNTGNKEMILAVYIDEAFNPDDPDTITGNF